MKLCHILTIYRRRKKLTRAAFAKRAKLSATTLRTLELEIKRGNKKPKPTLATVEKLASAMKITMRDLLIQLDAQERAYFNLSYKEPSILEKAEKELPQEQRKLLEQIALEFLKKVRHPDPEPLLPVFVEIEDMVPQKPSALRLSEFYKNSVNVFTDASFYTSPGETSPDRFTASVIVTVNSEFISGTLYAGRTGIGQRGGEEYAVWLGFLEALKHRKEGQRVNIFTDHSAFCHVMSLITKHSANGSPLLEIPDNKNLKSYAFGLATHIAEKAVAENVPLQIWNVKGHLSPGNTDSVARQIDAFTRQNDCDVDRNIAKALCTYNRMADSKAREFRKKMSEKDKAVWAVLPKETFAPLPLTAEQWSRFHCLSLRVHPGEEIPKTAPTEKNPKT